MHFDISANNYMKNKKKKTNNNNNNKSLVQKRQSHLKKGVRAEVIKIIQLKIKTILYKKKQT